MIVHKRYIDIYIFLNLFLNFILCDVPLVNFVEPISQNDSIVSIYGRFFGKSIQDVNVEIDLGKGFERYSISEWSSTSLKLNVIPPLPKSAHLKLSVSQYTINHTISFMNPNCMGQTQCNGHGICPGGLKCECLEPWSGSDCSTIEGEDMLKLIDNKLKVVPLPNHLDSFQTSIGLVLKEVTINGYVVNSYLLAPSQEYGSINSGDFLVNRYKTNTFMSSADHPFNCDITLNHYLSNQTSSIGSNYIYQVKDGIGLAVIVRNFISKSSTNKLKLYLYPMVVSLNSTTQSKVSVSKIDNEDDIITSNPSTTISKNNYDTVNLIIDDQKLRSNIYDFGLVLGNQSTFNTSVEKLVNISNLNNNNNNINSSQIQLYSVLSISAISSKYLYFFSDFYPTKIETINNIPPLNNNTQTPTATLTPTPTNQNSNSNSNNNNNNSNQLILNNDESDDTIPPSQSSLKPSPTPSHQNNFNIYENGSTNIFTTSTSIKITIITISIIILQFF